MDDIEYKQKRLRYLQLKAKAGTPAAAESVGESISPLQQKLTIAKTLAGQLAKPVIENAPEMFGTAAGTIAATGVGAGPTALLSGAGAVGGEIANQARQAVTGNNPPQSMGESLKRQGGAFVRGATAGVSPAIVEKVAPLVKGAGKTVATGFEKLSGLSYDTPGALVKEFNDPLLIFSKGIESARKLYDKVKGNGSKVADDLADTLSKSDFVEKAGKLAKEGNLNPLEALEARKTLDSMRKKVPQVAYHKMRQLFDSIAKRDYSAADKAFSKARNAEAIRDVMPKNKTGTPSIGKMVLGGFVPPAAVAMSPIVQGLTAGTLGTMAMPIKAALSNPASTAGLADAIAQILSKK